MHSSLGGMDGARPDFFESGVGTRCGSWFGDMQPNGLRFDAIGRRGGTGEDTDFDGREETVGSVFDSDDLVADSQYARFRFIDMVEGDVGGESDGEQDIFDSLHHLLSTKRIQRRY
jgi:hypothetical protein